MVEQNLSYEKLASLYDLLMQGIDYEAWVSYVEAVVAHFEGKISSIADLACGTGNSTFSWAEGDYTTFGVDLSAEMLAIARRKAADRGCKITFLEQDLRSLELPEKVDLAVCFQDGLNYILDPRELAAAFQSVFENLNNGGFFIFDLNYLPRLLPENEEIYKADEDQFSLAWRTKYLEKEQLWEIVISGTLKGDGEEDHFCETHREKIYDSAEVWSLLIDHGFTVLGTYQAFSFSPPHERAPRLVYAAQKTVPGK